MTGRARARARGRARGQETVQHVGAAAVSAALLASPLGHRGLHLGLRLHPRGARGWPAGRCEEVAASKAAEAPFSREARLVLDLGW